MTVYLSLAEVLAMHQQLVERYGGAHGARDMGALEAALYRPQSGYYDDIIWEGAALMESLAMNHPFVDGNKRVAFAATDVFLRINGYRLQANSQAIYKQMMAWFEQHEFQLAHIERYLREVAKPVN